MMTNSQRRTLAWLYENGYVRTEAEVRKAYRTSARQIVALEKRGLIRRIGESLSLTSRGVFEAEATTLIPVDVINRHRQARESLVSAVRNGLAEDPSASILDTHQFPRELADIGEAVRLHYVHNQP